MLPCFAKRTMRHMKHHLPGHSHRNHKIMAGVGVAVAAAAAVAIAKHVRPGMDFDHSSYQHH